MARKDLLGRLADAGEEAIQKLSESPGADRLTGVAHAMRDRMDELQKRVRGIDALEKRVAELEARVEQLSGARRAARAPATRKTGTTTRRKTTAATTPAAKSPAAKGPAAKGARRKPTAPKRGPGATGGASPG